jgi:hypothetical protein
MLPIGTLTVFPVLTSLNRFRMPAYSGRISDTFWRCLRNSQQRSRNIGKPSVFA